MLNKKFLFVFFVILNICLIPLFAESSDKYTVTSTTGTVRVKNDGGLWVSVTEEMKLNSQSEISVGINSSLVISLNEEQYFISAMKRGVIQDLVDSLAENSGLKIGDKLVESDINSDDVQGRSNISTASTRADDADDELEWLEE